MKLFLIIPVLCISLFFAGCGGIKSRIKANELQFDAYPPETQAQIQSGRIDHGFTEEMVYIARGKPDEKTTEKRDGKTLAVWKYGRSIPTSPPSPANGNISTPYGYPSFGPGPNQPTPMFYDRAYFKVFFDKGKVVAWDQDMQN